MFRKTSLLAATIFAATGALSAETSVHGMAGLILGSNGSRTSMTGNLYNSTYERTTEAISTKPGNLRFLSGGTVGATLMLDDFFIGLSGDVAWANDKATQKLEETTAQYRAKGARWGVSASFGYQCQNASPYLRLGAKWKPVRVYIEKHDTSSDPAVDSTMLNVSKNFGAFSTGIGFLWNTSDYVDVGVEGSIDFYGRKTLKQTVTLGAESYDQSLKVTPRDVQALMYIRFNFGK